MEQLDELEAMSRAAEPVEAEPSQPARKRPRTDAAAAAAQLLAEAERELETSQVEVVQVDANTMKRMVLSVEKRINENMQLRMKYADAPERYMDSELALFQELKAMHTLATAPELYATFVRTRCVPSLLGLLAHENADISMDVVDLFHELCEAEDAEPDALLALVDAMLENGAAAALMQHLGRLDEAEEEEAACVHHTLSIFESVLEAKPTAAADVAQQPGLLAWLLSRLKARAFHANKLFASELLAVLLQQNSANQRFLGEADGVLALLTAASHYKRREPVDLEEAELVENVYNCLCAALGDGENQARFLRAEGVELMILALKERRYASRCALRVLDAALRANGANCERLVDIRGFKTLFPLLGAPPPPPPTVKGKAEKAAFARQYDESLTSLLATLFHELGAERRQRLLGKFAEEGMAKLTKLLELHAAYAERVADAEAAALSFRDDGDDDDDDEAADERAYLAALEAGSYTLQCAAVCVGYVATAKNKELRQCVMRTLYEQGSSLHAVAARVGEYLASAAAGPQDAAMQKSMAAMREALGALLAKYQPAAAADAPAEEPPAAEAS